MPVIRKLTNKGTNAYANASPVQEVPSRYVDVASLAL
jgi:hypothetical protein